MIQNEYELLIRCVFRSNPAWFQMKIETARKETGKPPDKDPFLRHNLCLARDQACNADVCISVAGRLKRETDKRKRGSRTQRNNTRVHNKVPSEKREKSANL